MRRALLLCFSVTTLVTTFSKAHAQADRFAYAITDLSKDGAGWNALRRLDLQTGTFSDVLLNGTDQKIICFDATSKKQITPKPDARYGTLLQAPFSTGVAAAAYDKKHNRLYFTPMFIDQLRYIDLRTMKVYTVTDQPFTKLGTMHNDEAKIVTRMVITPDGLGYAITNDGNAVIQFTTGKKTTIKQLGALVDDATNGAVSIHNKCSSFGGDMVADDAGNLFIISASRNVFKVNTETKVAKLLGSIEGLPAGYTVNGAVVDADGALLVSSAVDGKNYFEVDAKSWKATPFTLAASVYRSSDLANSNFLATRPPTKVIDRVEKNRATFNAIQIYPNPVTTNNFNVQFTNLPAGTYTIDLTDVMGRSVLQKTIVLNSAGQVQQVALNAANAKGIYLVKVIDRNKKSVFEQKVMVQ